MQFINTGAGIVVFEAVMSFAPGDAASIFTDLVGLMDVCGAGHVKVTEPAPGGGTITWTQSPLAVPELAAGKLGEL